MCAVLPGAQVGLLWVWPDASPTAHIDSAMTPPVITRGLEAYFDKKEAAEKKEAAGSSTAAKAEEVGGLKKAPKVGAERLHAMDGKPGSNSACMCSTWPT